MVPEELRASRSSRTDSVPAVSPLLCSLLAGPGACACLKSCILLEALGNCQRGKADFVCSHSFPRSVILHYCTTASKAKKEKSEEWMPVTFAESATGGSNLLPSVNTAGFG